MAQDRAETSDAQDRGRLTQRAAAASMTVALILLVLKAVAAVETGSVAVLGSLADSALDLFASFITLLGVRWAAMPADEEHRFGHGKAEALSALFQGMIIMAAAGGIAWEAARRVLGEGAEATPSAGGTELGIAVSVLAMGLSLLLIAYQKRVIARTGSIAISTDNLHYMSDMLLNMSVIIALVLDRYFGLAGADALFGLVIALWLARGAWVSASRAVDNLMDKEWSVEDRRHFLDIALSHPELRGIHDMRTRTSGPERFVQFHVSVDPEMTVRRAHEVMDQVEDDLHRAFPDVEILIHPDPYGYDQREKMDDPLRAAEARTLLDAEVKAEKAKPGFSVL
ncbi:MAG: cation transporter [Sphingobium sp.]|nr:cation transporter [Sphingobium sp.]